jgi:hypothetical protein
MKTRVVPTGLAHLFHFTRHFRAGLSYPAATRMECWWRLLHRLRSMVVLTQSLLAALSKRELNRGLQQPLMLFRLCALDLFYDALDLQNVICIVSREHARQMGN